MSEEKKMSAFKAFAQNLQTFAEAEEKAKKEAGAPKVERFRIGEDGEYSVRILPLAPVLDDDGNVLPMDRKGYEYPLHQLFLGIKVPTKKGAKPKKINIPVICATDKGVGYTIDLIDTYVKIAQEMYADDEDLIKLVKGNSFSGGLRWNYQHAIMVIDVSSEKERNKGPQLWQCSHSQYKDIDDAKMRLWKELREDGGQETCPISWFTDAYPVKVIRGNNGGKTEYKMEIGRKTLDVKEEEADKLLALPRIPELIYRYTRYQLEATIVFLQQYDEEHDMQVCQEPDFKEAIEKLKGELPVDDTSHFDLNGVSAKDNGKDEVTIDSLWREYDLIVDQDLNEKSDEYQELREKIRQYIEDKGLDVRISRTKNNQQLLEEIDDALLELQPKSAKKDDVDEDKPSKRPSRPAVEKSEPEDAETSPNKVDETDEAEAEKPRARRPRPSADDLESQQNADNEPEPETSDDEQPRRRLRARRLR